MSQRPDAASESPRGWHWWTSSAGECNQQEAVAAIRHPVGGTAPTDTEVQMRLAEFKRVVKDAQLGLLADAEWEPVARDPMLWELRWRWEGGVEVRGYFHEPAGKWGHRAILARVHVKWISSASDPGTCEREIRAVQNQEIHAAGRRVRAESAAEWGLPDTPRIVSS